MKAFAAVFLSFVLLLQSCTIGYDHVAHNDYCDASEHFQKTEFTIQLTNNRQQVLELMGKYFPGLDWKLAAGLSLMSSTDLKGNPHFTHSDMGRAPYNFELSEIDKDHIQLCVSGFVCSPKAKKRVREIERTMRKLLR